MSTKRISTLILVTAMLLFGQGCASRKQQAVDRSMLIQENLQLDQALSIAQYELMLTREENEMLRNRLAQSPANDGRSKGRLPALRSTYEAMPNETGPAPTFDPHDSTLPPPSNQMPSRFQRQENQRPNQPQHVEVPIGAPQWSPQR